MKGLTVTIPENQIEKLVTENLKSRVAELLNKEELPSHIEKALDKRLGELTQEVLSSELFSNTLREFIMKKLLQRAEKIVKEMK